MISESYRKIMSKAHKEPKYGKRVKFPKYLDEFIQERNPKSLIDFGCGKGRLRETIEKRFPGISYRGYDPCVEEFNYPLNPVDLIFSTDVLEHVEPEFINATLREIRENCKYTYHLISCAPAKLILADGRNAHLIQQGAEWWKKQFNSVGFKVIKEEWIEKTKYSKELRKDMPIKEYIILAK